MLLLRLAGRPTETSCDKDGGRERATHVASQRSSSEKKRGNRPGKIRPGSAVLPCSVWRVLAALMVMGSWRRCTAFKAGTRDRCQVVVAATFHGAGMVVPYDKKTQVREPLCRCFISLFPRLVSLSCW